MLSNKAKRELKINQRRDLIDSIEISIPSPQQILTWGERELPNGKKVGEVKNSKTVNYKKFTPLRDGLFCERIFGPINSFMCACGKRQPAFDVSFCDKCEVEYIDKQVRRSRLGYISLVSPVVHVWYLKGRPSYLSLFLGKRKKQMTALAYCNAYLVEQSLPNLNHSNHISTFNKKETLAYDSLQSKRNPSKTTTGLSNHTNTDQTENRKISQFKSTRNQKLKISANTLKSFSKIRQLSNCCTAYNQKVLRSNLLKTNKRINSNSSFLDLGYSTSVSPSLPDAAAQSTPNMRDVRSTEFASRSMHMQKTSGNSATTLNIIKSKFLDKKELSSNLKRKSQKSQTSFKLPLISQTRVSKPYQMGLSHLNSKQPISISTFEDLWFIKNQKDPKANTLKQGWDAIKKITDVLSYGENKLATVGDAFSKNQRSKVVFSYFFHILIEILNNAKNNSVLKSYTHSTPSLFGQEERLDFINWYLQRSTNFISFFDLYLHPQAKSFYKNQDFQKLPLYQTKVQKVKNIKDFAKQTLRIEQNEESTLLRGFSLPISKDTSFVKKDIVSDREYSCNLAFPTSATFFSHALKRVDLFSKPNSPDTVTNGGLREVPHAPGSALTSQKQSTDFAFAPQRHQARRSYSRGGQTRISYVLPHLFAHVQDEVNEGSERNKARVADTTSPKENKLKNERHSIGQKSILNNLTKKEQNSSLFPDKSNTSYFLHSHTPEKQIKQYNRAQSLPFLPSLICKYNVREELVTFFNSNPLHSDIPIPVYSQIHRWQALYDVHKYMAEQSLSSSTDVNYESYSGGDKRVDQNQLLYKTKPVVSGDSQSKSKAFAPNPFYLSRASININKRYTRIKTTGFFDDTRFSNISGFNSSDRAFLPHIRGVSGNQSRLEKNSIGRVSFNKQTKNSFYSAKIFKQSRDSINPTIEKWIHCIKKAIPIKYSIKTLNTSFESDLSNLIPRPPLSYSGRGLQRFTSVKKRNKIKRASTLGKLIDSAWPLVLHLDTFEQFLANQRPMTKNEKTKIFSDFNGTLGNKSFNVFCYAKKLDVKLNGLPSNESYFVDSPTRLNKVSKDLEVLASTSIDGYHTTESYFTNQNISRQDQLLRQKRLSLYKNQSAKSKLVRFLNVSFLFASQVVNRMPQLFQSKSKSLETLLSQILINKKSLVLVANNLQLQIKAEISSEIVTNILNLSRAYNYVSICLRFFYLLSTFEKRLVHNVYNSLSSFIENKALKNVVGSRSNGSDIKNNGSLGYYDSVGTQSISTDLLFSPVVARNRTTESRDPIKAERNVLLSLFLIPPGIKAATAGKANAMDNLIARKVNPNFENYCQQKIQNVAKDNPNLYTFVEIRSTNSTLNPLNVSNIQVQHPNTTSQVVLTRNIFFATLAIRRNPLDSGSYLQGELESKKTKSDLLPLQEFDDNSQMIQAPANGALDSSSIKEEQNIFDPSNNKDIVKERIQFDSETLTPFEEQDANSEQKVTSESFSGTRFDSTSLSDPLELNKWNISNKKINGSYVHDTNFLKNENDNGLKHNLGVSSQNLTPINVSPTLNGGTSKWALTGGKQAEMLSHLELSTIREILAYTGGGALEAYLKRIDVLSFFNFLSADIATTRIIYRNKLAKIGYGNQVNRKQKRVLTRLARRLSINSRRLKIVQLFLRNKRRPEWMMISALPVLPPDLRPILQMSESVVVASDINNLYQRVIYRNNRFHKLGFIDFHLVTAIQRLVQDAVDRLIENGKGASKPFYTPAGRPLKSLSDTLKGKKGRFRYNLLGKRVDFSGRSVIVVSPQLRIQECGLPKEIALELYHYFLLRHILLKKEASSIVIAKKLIKQRKPTIWNMLRAIIYHHPVLLNRAPTLHRLGIQAFQPKLIDGNAIWLHPLVCSAFNADFDGDQMGVHLPLSTQARAEAWDLLWSRNNLLSPATGQPVLVPSQDMVLGFYYMTQSFASPGLISEQKTQKQIQSFNESTTHSSSIDAVIPHSETTESYHSPRMGLAQTTFLDGRSHRSLSVRQLDPSKQFFYDILQLLYAFQTGKISLHTPVWLALKSHETFEHDKSSLLPLEIRINSFANSTYIFSEYKRRRDETTSEFATSIRTTAGKVLVNVFLY